MHDNLLSARLQHDILRALSVFHPQSPTGRQYYSCFSDISDIQMTANITVLINQKLVSARALKTEGDETSVRLSHLRLTPEGFDYAVKNCFIIM